MGIARSLSFAVLLLASAACGKVQTFADANPDEIDATSVDASLVGEITVETYTRCCVNPGQLVSGIDIVAIDPDGTVHTALTVDGTATLEIYSGASVTAIYRPLTGGILSTVLGVEPGDHLIFGEQFLEGGAVAGTMTANYPALGGAASYNVFHRCGNEFASSTQLSVVLDRNASCDEPTQDLLYLAFETGNVLSRWGFQEDVAFVAGGSTTLATWLAPNSFTMTFNNVPDGLNIAAQIQGVLNGRPSYFVFESDGTPVGGSYSFTRAWAPAGDQFTGGARFDSPDGMQFAGEALPINTTQWVLDDPITLPFLRATAFDQPSRTATVTLVGQGASDGLLVDLRYDRPSEKATYTWTVFGPPAEDGEVAVVFPDLPAAFDGFEPQATDTFNPQGMLWDYSQASGFDAARGVPEWERGDLAGNILIRGGRVSIASFLDAAPPQTFFPPSLRR